MNFLLLHVGMTILVSPNLSSLYCDFADDLLKLFVQHFAELYGSNMLVYNIHAPTHLAGDVKRFGCVDSFSAFPFENFLCSLKKLVRKPKFPLEQIIRRMSERSSCQLDRKIGQKEQSKFQNEHFGSNVPVGFLHCKQFKKFVSEGISIAIRSGDNCIKVKGQIVLVQNILFDELENLGYFVVQKCQSCKDFFTYPMASSRIGIFVISFREKLEVVAVSGFEPNM